MIMTTKRHIFHHKALARLSRLLLCTSAPLFLASCNDFLDILPLNEVVLENYWTEKADVNSVLNSCYETLEHSDALTRMGIWGELRSDNLMAGDNVRGERDTEREPAAIQPLLQMGQDV